MAKEASTFGWVLFVFFSTKVEEGSGICYQKFGNGNVSVVIVLQGSLEGSIL